MCLPQSQVDMWSVVPGFKAWRVKCDILKLLLLVRNLLPHNAFCVLPAQVSMIDDTLVCSDTMVQFALLFLLLYGVFDLCNFCFGLCKQIVFG